MGNRGSATLAEMEIKWLNAIIDLPASDFDAVGDFWAEMTATTKGEIHPDHDEYVHLDPRSGHRYLELQRLDDGPARAHLDIVVDRAEMQAWTERSVELGATVLAQPGHIVLETPGGMPFCIVPFSDESDRTPAIDADRPHAVDQICLDIPHDLFDTDVAFWSSLTGWAVNPAQLDEFRSFAQPTHLPLRLLVQRLGADDTGGARAHLDISSGEHVAALTEVHIANGATVTAQTERWTALTDPAGMPYCLTSRPPNLD